MGQFEEGFQPVFFGHAIVCDFDPSIGPGDDRENGDGEDVEKCMAVVFGTGIGEVVESARNQRGRISIHAELLYERKSGFYSRRSRAMNLTNKSIPAQGMERNSQARMLCGPVICGNLDAIALCVYVPHPNEFPHPPII